jgi:uncharacterized coiled-coil protein SlyX
MRLTNTIRQAFVKAAMQDVPKIDYAEQIRVMLEKAAKEALSPKVRAVWEDNHLRGFVTDCTEHYTFGYRPNSVRLSVVLPSNHSYSLSGYTLPKEVIEKVNELGNAWAVQEKTLSELSDKLIGAAASVSTREALVKLLPEFEKYLPVDESSAQKTNLPAVANIVSDFVKAGWPKQNQGKIAKAKAAPVAHHPA